MFVMMAVATDTRAVGEAAALAIRATVPSTSRSPFSHIPAARMGGAVEVLPIVAQ